jgi:hypothetical protein
MNSSIDTISTKAQLIFWQAASKTMRFALHHRKEVHQALTIAPIAIIAMAAFILGHGLGLLIEAGLL